MTRSHRRGPEKLIFSHTFRCKECGYRLKETYLHTGFSAKYACCPRCSNPAPDQRSRPDKVDSMLHSPIRFAHWLFRGNLYHCVFCRLQFYDIRGLNPNSKRNTVPAANKARMAS
jgi:hypothetical protein